MLEAAQMVGQLEVLFFAYGDAHVLGLEPPLQILHDLTDTAATSGGTTTTTNHMKRSAGTIKM